MGHPLYPVLVAFLRQFNPGQSRQAPDGLLSRFMWSPKKTLVCKGRESKAHLHTTLVGSFLDAVKAMPFGPSSC